MIRFTEVSDMTTWNSLITQFPEANFLQSWEWGDAHEALGSTVVRRAILQDSVVVGLFSGIIKNARRGRYFEIPGGPLIEWRNKELAKRVRDELKKIAKTNRCVFVRIRPQYYSTQEYLDILRGLGFRRAPMHLHAEDTSMIDLSQNTETLLMSMRQQTRYEVKRAAKQEIVISKSRSQEAIDEFYTLQHATAHRQKFIPPSHNALRSYQQAFNKSLTVYKAEKEGNLLNLALVVTYGNEVDYFEAASSVDGKKEPGAYAIIWQSIQDAKHAGALRYNLWGIAPDANLGHRYGGVTIFKRGFGGEDVYYLPAHDIIVDPLRYPLNYLVETVRKKRRKL